MTETTRIAVDGGELAVAEWGEEGSPPLLAVHGITASRLAWQTFARELPEARLIAPDLRGRGRSRTLPGPYGLRQHVADLEEVIERLGVAPLPVVGHSMGAFVAVLLAARRPDAVDALILVDGGLPLRRPEGVDDAELPARVLGPAAERLRMTFPDREAYRDFWRAHPAFRDAWSRDIEEYVDADLVEADGALRPSSVLDAVAADSLELYGPEWYLAALRSLRVPVTVLRAPRGLLDEPDGLYPPGALEDAASLVPGMRALEVDDVNHYTILMSPRGARAVASAVRETQELHPTASASASTTQAKEPE